MLHQLIHPPFNAAEEEKKLAARCICALKKCCSRLSSVWGARLPRDRLVGCRGRLAARPGHLEGCGAL